MKVKFEKLQYQIDAVQSIIDLFKGQEECVTEFTLSAQPAPGQATLSDSVLAIGIGNEQKISDEELSLMAKTFLVLTIVNIQVLKILKKAIM